MKKSQRKTWLPKPWHQVQTVAIEPVRHSCQQIQGQYPNQFLPPCRNGFIQQVQKRGHQEQADPHLNIPSVGNRRKIQNLHSPSYPCKFFFMHIILPEQDGENRKQQVSEQHTYASLVVPSGNDPVRIEIPRQHDKQRHAYGQ